MKAENIPVNGMLYKMTNSKHILSLSICIVCILISLVGCATVKVESPAPLSPPTPSQQLIPIVSEIKPAPFVKGARTFTIKGNYLDSETIVEIYNSSGNIVASSRLKKSGNEQVADFGKNLDAGNYTVKIKSKDGLSSNSVPITIPKLPTPPKPTSPVEKCTGSLPQKLSVLYLGGGDAKKLFESFLSQHSEKKDIDYSLMIKFYEKGKDTADLTLQIIKLDDMESAFVESPEDFLEKIKKRLQGKVAEFSETLIEDAGRDNAGYFQCAKKNTENSER